MSPASHLKLLLVFFFICSTSKSLHRGIYRNVKSLVIRVEGNIKSFAGEIYWNAKPFVRVDGNVNSFAGGIYRNFKSFAGEIYRNIFSSWQLTEKSSLLLEESTETSSLLLVVSMEWSWLGGFDHFDPSIFLLSSTVKGFLVIGTFLVFISFLSFLLSFLVFRTCGSNDSLFLLLHPFFMNSRSDIWKQSLAFDTWINCWRCSSMSFVATVFGILIWSNRNVSEILSRPWTEHLSNEEI